MVMRCKLLFAMFNLTNSLYTETGLKHHPPVIT